MRLEIQEESGNMRVFETHERLVTIGRGSDNVCQIIGDGISRTHLQLEIKKGLTFVKDLGSSNGTFISDKKLSANKEYEWQALFPIKIGSRTYISQLPEKEIAGLNQTTIMTSTSLSSIQKPDNLTKTIHRDEIKDNTSSQIIKDSTSKPKGSLKNVIISFVLFMTLAFLFYAKPELIQLLLNQIESLLQ